MQLSDQEKHTQLNLDSSLALGPATPMTKQKSREFVIQIPSITKKGKGIVRDILTKCTDLIVEIINESESNDPLNTINNKFFSPQSKILKLQVTSTLFGMLSKCLPARYYELIKRFDDRYGNETEEMTPELNAFLTLLTGNVDILSSLQLFSKNKTDRSNSQILIECPILNGVGLNDPKTPETVLNFIYNTQSGFMALQIKLLIIISDFSEGKSMLKYQLCKEEDVMQCVSIVKSQMHSMFFLLDEMFENESVSNYKQLLQIFHERNIQDTLSHSFKTLIDILGQFQQLLQTQKLNDDIVISLIFLCIELFCMKKSEETAFFRNCVNYQEEASKLLILIFSNYEHHRIFIIEEVILTIPKSKFKTADYRIANSKKMIHRHSSLLLQLVQSTNPILKEYEHLDKESVLYSEKLEKFMLKCKSDLQSANKCSQNILKFLVARITNTNKTDSKAKNGYDAEYKHILEALLKDVHILFLNLEWPIVNHFITQATLVLIQLLDDNNKNIDSSLRSIATEWLGDTSTIIRKQEKQDCEELKKLRNEGELLGPHTWNNERYVDFSESLQDELLQTISDKSLDILFKQGLISFYVSTFVSEVSTEESFESIHPRTVQYIDSCISKLCSLKNDFKPNLKHQMVEYDSLTIFKYFQQSHNLSKLNDLILKSLIERIHGDNIPARTKSLRSMFELLIDSSISSSIRHLILQEVTHSLSDNSPTVRDASMEVVCRYLLSQDESVLKTLISTASSRIMDLSVNVRKRAIKLFRDIYLKYDQLENMDILQDITIKLFSRLTDEETSVSDLAKKVIGDYFFSNATDSVGWEQLNEQSKSLMIQKMTILSNVFSSYSQSVPLFTIFMNSITTLGLEQYHQQVELMINALMQMILTANENDELDQMTRYSTTMNQLSIYFPKECSIHISSLYPFSKPSKKTTDKDSRIIQNVLNIITKSIVTVEYPDQQLIQLIETDLISMLSVQNQAVLKVAIPCLCAIVQHHSRNFGKIVNVIKLCVDERDADGALKLSILVGNATEFSEDGIPSALIQNYLDDILKMMLGKDDKLSRQSFQVIRLALELGIVHPLLKSKRNEYIKMIINLFQFPKEKSFGYDKTFYQFLAINLAYLDMKTHDEVLHVIYHINLMLSVSGEIVKSNLEKLEENVKPEFRKYLI
ncbi:Sister chromatid cohesion protein 2 [Globomyces sp. JEL0801]|nr:Sister chromatid cohesion protein 2 [Globomyces sp. JEL0801]